LDLKAGLGKGVLDEDKGGDGDGEI